RSCSGKASTATRTPSNCFLGRRQPSPFLSPGAPPENLLVWCWSTSWGESPSPRCLHFACWPGSKVTRSLWRPRLL
ncbi:unnamed protein product, partial [Ixodes pacificus]